MLDGTDRALARRECRQRGWPAAAVLLVVALFGLAPAPRDVQEQASTTPDYSEPRAAQSGGVPGTDAEFSRRIREIEEYLQAFAKTSVVPGVSVAVDVAGTFTWFGGFGVSDLISGRPVTPHARFRIGSVSKALTAAALGLLLEEGKLELDADVRKYVPEFPSKGKPITLRHLATHRSGIRHYRGNEALNDRPYTSVLEALTVFAKDPLVARPGTTHSYSSYGYTLLSAAMERGAALPFLTLMKAKVLNPLQMTDTEPEVGGRLLPDQATGYEQGPNGKAQVAPRTDLSVVWAGGGFVSTTGDLVKFARAHFDGSFLRRETMDVLWAAQATKDGTKVPSAFGWQAGRTPKGRRLLVSGGNSIGGTTVMFVVPEEKAVLVFMTNMGNAPIRGVPMGALRILLGEDRPPAAEMIR